MFNFEWKAAVPFCSPSNKLYNSHQACEDHACLTVNALKVSAVVQDF